MCYYELVQKTSAHPPSVYNVLYKGSTSSIVQEFAMLASMDMFTLQK